MLFDLIPMVLFLEFLSSMVSLVDCFSPSLACLWLYNPSSQPPASLNVLTKPLSLWNSFECLSSPVSVFGLTIMFLWLTNFCPRKNGSLSSCPFSISILSLSGTLLNRFNRLDYDSVFCIL